ncbi:hypothetical protein HK097_010418 [Rhizophlyctis rosea]|uniref:Xrn1 N-terminal domain-containing protein n=1 Tax=Rhizophlyctis rosea TaxID=64517 RepID=A0AAD5SI52_9FUNG|nr:hypothetical protein HK097_010418 [Rhizophlyctis rosea]
MGIPGIGAWLDKNYPAAITPLEGGRKAAKTLQPEKQQSYVKSVEPLFQKVIQRKSKERGAFDKEAISGVSLDDIIKRLLAPQNHVYLAIDGPAPLAKLFLQRRRRMAAGKKQKAGRFDSRSFTPGTEFMIQLDEFLSFYSCRYLSTSTRNVPRLAITISGASVAGEGELKIIHHINTLPKATADTVAIVGSDGDILLQTLLSGSPNTHVINYDAGTVFSPTAMVQSLQKHFPDRDARKVARDWACLILLRGSDYLPKLPHTTLNNLWRQYGIFARKQPSEYLIIEEQSGNLKLNSNCLGTILGGENWRDEAVWQKMRAYEVEHRHRRFDDEDGYDMEEAEDEGTEEEDEDDEESGSEAMDVDDDLDSETSEDEDGEAADDIASADDVDAVIGDELLDSIDGSADIDEDDDEEIIVFEPTIRCIVSETNAHAAIRQTVATEVLQPSSITTSMGPSSDSSTFLYLSGILWILRMYQTGEPSTYSFNYPSNRGPTRVTVLKYLRAVEEGMEPTPVCPSVSLPGSDAMHPLVCAAMLLGNDGKHLFSAAYHTLIDACEEMEKKGMDYNYLTQLHSTLPVDQSYINQSVTYRNLPRRDEEDIPHYNKHWPKTPEGFNFEFRRVFVRELGGARGNGLIGEGGGVSRGGPNTQRGRGGGFRGRGGYGRGGPAPSYDATNAVPFTDNSRQSGHRTYNIQMESMDAQGNWRARRDRGAHVPPTRQAPHRNSDAKRDPYPQRLIYEGAWRGGARSNWRGRGGNGSVDSFSGVRGRGRGRGRGTSE